MNRYMHHSIARWYGPFHACRGGKPRQEAIHGNWMAALMSGVDLGTSGFRSSHCLAIIATLRCLLQTQNSRVFVLALLLLFVPAPGAARLFCDGDAIDGWHFYCDPEPVPEVAPQPPAPPPPAEDIAEEDPEPQEVPLTATEQVAAFRKMAEEAKNRAILEPTIENVVAYMEINQRMAQMAGKFAAVWQRGLFQSPHLDANVKRPLTQMGTHIYQDQINAAREAALHRAASEAGLIFVFEDPVSCRVCLAQSQILAAIRKAYGIEVLAVSADGSAIEHFPDAVVDEGQLEALGVLDTPKPFIAMLDVETGEAQLIGGGLLTEDQILERIYVIREVPVGERYE